MKKVLFIVALIVGVITQLGAEGKVRVGLAPLDVDSSDTSLPVIAEVIRDTMQFSLKLLGNYEVKLLDSVNPDVLESTAKNERLDNLIFGSLEQSSNGEIVFSLKVYTYAENSLTADVSDKAESVFDIFDTGDRLVLNMLETLAGRHIGFGGLTVNAPDLGNSYSILINGETAAENTSQVDKLVAGTYVVEIEENRLFGSEIIFSERIEILENQFTNIKFIAPILTPKEADKFYEAESALFVPWDSDETTVFDQEIQKLNEFSDFFNTRKFGAIYRERLSSIEQSIQKTKDASSYGYHPFPIEDGLITLHEAEIAANIIQHEYYNQNGEESLLVGTLNELAELNKTEKVLKAEADPVEMLVYVLYDSESDKELKADILIAYEELFHNGTLLKQYVEASRQSEHLYSQMKTEDKPNAAYIWPGEISAVVTSGNQFLDLRPWIKGRESLFIPSALEPQGPNGEIWELPESLTPTHIMYANNRILDQLGLDYPETFEELLAQSKIIREAGFLPIAMSNEMGWQIQSCLLGVLVERTAGLDWLNRAKYGNGAFFTDEEFVRALEIIDQLARAGMFLDDINTIGYNDAAKLFTSEKAVYMLDGAWRSGFLEGEMGKEKIDYISVHSFPDLQDQKGKSGSISVVPGRGFGIPAGQSEAETEAAWDWTWFYSGPRGSAFRNNRGFSSAYHAQESNTQNTLIHEIMDFVYRSPSAYVFDNKMSREGMRVLQQGIKELIEGRKNAQQVADEYEAWVAANEPARRKS